MSEAITGVLKFAFGLISKKLRTYGAEKLEDGGLTDQKFRDYIVREFDDFKFKLDSLSRKDLSASISFLKQGVQRLQMSFQNGKPPTSLPKDGEESKDTTIAGASSSQTKPAQQPVTVEDAVGLANAIRKLQIESKERFHSAKESFKEAGKKASEAFHNVALSTNERILATEVRIASGILENLDDPGLAASDCLQYLEELHAMPSIKEIFSVHLTGGIKSVFKRESRAEIVETVTMINLILADFISKFTKRRMAVLDWPLIECGKRVVHPIYYKKENVQKMREMKITPPWDIIRCNEKIHVPRDWAINSKGDVIGVSKYGDYNHLQKLDRATGEWQLLSPSDNKMQYHQNSVAVDDNDTVYVVSYDSYRVHSVTYKPDATLSVYSSDGKIIHHCTLDFIKAVPSLSFIVTKDKKIIIYPKGHMHDYCSEQSRTVYVCDCNGQLMKSFALCLNSAYNCVLHLFVPSDKSADEEIIVATSNGPEVSYAKQILLQVYAEDGQLKRTFMFSTTTWHNGLCGITFDHVARNYTRVWKFYGCMSYVECFSSAAELRNSLFLDRYIGSDYPDHLISHTKGALALVDSGCVFYLRSSLM